MVLTIAHVFLYALIQTLGVGIFTLALKRLGKLKRFYLIKAFIYLLMVNAAGTLTFGAESWEYTSRPVMAGLFTLGVIFFLAAHIYLFLRKMKR